MSLNIKKQTRKVAFLDKEVTYEAAQRGETASSQSFVEQMSLETGLPKGTINNVLQNITDALAPFFKLGHGVYLGRSGKEEEGLGIIYPKLQRKKEPVYRYDPETGKMLHDAEGNPVIDHVKTILSVGVGFRPSTALKALLAQCSVRDITATDSDDDDNDNDDDNSGSGQAPDSGTDQGGTKPPSLD